MGIKTLVNFVGLRRESNGYVSGRVTVKVYGDLFGHELDEELEKEFSFPQGGEQEIYREEMDIGLSTVTLSAKVYEVAWGDVAYRDMFKFAVELERILVQIVGGFLSRLLKKSPGRNGFLGTGPAALSFRPVSANGMRG